MDRCLNNEQYKHASVVGRETGDASCVSPLLYLVMCDCERRRKS